MDTRPTSFYHRARRSDGTSTRSTILNAAGQVFAELGYAGATNRAISDRAGTNTAAIAYYFGGKDGLYEAVLIEAHQQFIGLEELKGIVESKQAPEEKLSTVLRLLASRARNSSEIWGMTVFLREMIQASDFPPPALLAEVLPKLVLLRRLVQDITGFAPDSPEGRHAAAFMSLPCLALVLLPHAVKDIILPELKSEPEKFNDYLVTYAIGGLRAMREARQPS